MTIPSEIRRSGPYTGNGSTTVFDYDFKIFDETHLQVILTTNGVEADADPGDYTVSGVGNSNGQVTFDTPPDSGVLVTIILNVPFTQELDLENQGAFLAEDVESALDLAAQRDLQLREMIDRAIKVPASSDASDLEDLVAGVLALKPITAAISNVSSISSEVQTVAGISGDVETVAGISEDVTAVAQISTDVTTVAENIAAVQGADAAATAAAASAVAAAASAAAAADSAQNVNDALGLFVEPYIILATGQSNIARHGSHAWTPPTNLHLWGWDGKAGGDDDEDVGTAFAPMDDETMGYAYSYAAEFARDHPFRQVYLVNIGIGGAPIASWMTGDPDPDMYAACKNNVEAALAVLGRSAINEFVWWQGEADATSSTYAVDFETVIARFRAETWFPADTPILVTGISEIYSTNQTRFADTLRSVAGFEPGLRSYADIAKLPASIWEEDNIHLTAAGNEIAGRYAYKTTRQSSAAAALSKWKIVTKGAATARNNTATVADDPHLKFPVKANRTIQCRFNMNVVLSSTNPDFKFSVSGPAAFASQARWTYIVGSDAGAPKSGWSATYPSGVVIEHNTGAASNIFLTLELTITDPSEDGEVVFQWAQGTSHADIVGVSAGSYVEYFDIGFTHA